MSATYPYTPQFFGPNGDAIINDVKNALTLNTTTGILTWAGTLTQNTIIDATAANYEVRFGNTSLALPNLLYINGAGISVGIGSSSYDGTNPERLLVDAGTANSVNVISGYADYNSYRQLNIKNTNAGSSASSDIVATANNGNETTNFIDMGINSSTYSDAAFAASALDGYLYNNGGNLFIGTATAAKGIRFHVGGTATANVQGYIDPTGKWGIGNISAPVTQMDNYGTIIGDGTYNVNATKGLLWAAPDATAFVTALYNSSGGPVLLLKTSSPLANVPLIHAQNVNNNVLIVKRSGIGIGANAGTPATLLNNFSDLTSQTDGTTTTGSQGLGFQVAATGYAGAFVNTGDVAAANGFLARTTRNATDAYVAKFLYGNTTVGMVIRADGRVGIGTATPGSTLDVAMTYAASAVVATFGSTYAASAVTMTYGASSDVMTLAIGTDFSLVRNGGGSPYISSSQAIETRSPALYVNASGNAGTMYVKAFSGSSGRIGAFNTAPCTLEIGNVGGASEFLHLQTSIFRNGKVAVNDTNVTTINASAALEVNSTTRGFLPSRMTTGERTAISSPADGLLVFDTDQQGWYGYAGGIWQLFFTS
jgi:hypothetical protein